MSVKVGDKILYLRSVKLGACSLTEDVYFENKALHYRYVIFYFQTTFLKINVVF
jgi:hypothetical protein